MALTRTTLSSACAGGPGVQPDKQIVVASATGFVAGYLIKIDQELMQVVKTYTTGTTIPVLRGVNGTAPQAHQATAGVVVGIAAAQGSGGDYDTPAAQQSVLMPTSRPVIVQSITTTPSTLGLPDAGCDLRIILNGTGAIALTIPVPTLDCDGCELTIVSNGVAAHTLTFTGGLSGAGSNYDVITINATAPAAFKFIAANALWMAICGPGMGGTVTNIIGSVA